MSLPTTYKALFAQGKGKQPTLEDIPLEMPGKNQILVKIAFTPINPVDFLTIKGIYLTMDPPYRVGFEASGTVVAVGEDLKVTHKVGDRVHVYTHGTLAEYVLADADQCRKIKGDLSFENAASHFINPATIVTMGDYIEKNGHKAVVHTAGSSALGRMLIRYLKHKGIKTINIVRRDDVIEELKREGADSVLNSKAPNFEEQLKEIAHKENATLAFEAVTGEMTAKVLKSLPEKSTVAIYGLLEGEGDVSALNGAQFLLQGKTLTGFHMPDYLKPIRDTAEGVRLLDEAYDLLPTILGSAIQRVFKLDEIFEGLSFYDQNSSKGKILIQSN